MAMTFGGAGVSHASKTQAVVALSTSEAEYIAATEGVQEAFFLFAFCACLRACVRSVLAFVDSA